MPRIDSKHESTDRVESIRPDGTVSPELRRARIVLLGMFALLGITMSSWLARIPSVRDALDLTTSGLGIVLLAGAVGGLLTVTVAGPFVTRFGGRLAYLAASLAFGVGFAMLGLGPALGELWILAVGIFLTGVGTALGNVVLNVESAGVERRIGRTILPQFHAAFSIGAVLGSLVGAACAAAGVPVLGQFLATAVLATAWRVAALPSFIHDTALARPVDVAGATPADATPAGSTAIDAMVEDATHAPVRPSRRVRLGAALGAWRERRTLMIGLVVLAAALSEGSANDWLSIAVVDGFGKSEAVGGLVFGGFVASMTLMRLLGTRLIDRYGRVPVLRVSGVASIVGLLLFGFAPSLGLAGAGVVLWGFGAALAVPIGIAAASDDPMRAAGRVSVVSAFASMASLAAPPLLGLAAEHVGARHALVVIVAAMVLSALLAANVEPLPTRVPLGRASGAVPAADLACEDREGDPYGRDPRDRDLNRSDLNRSDLNRSDPHHRPTAPAVAQHQGASA